MNLCNGLARGHSVASDIHPVRFLTLKEPIKRTQKARHAFITNHVWRDHVLLGAAVAAILLWVWNPLHCLIFWLTNILVDFDHYLNMLFWSRWRCRGIAQVLPYYSYISANRHRFIAFITIEIFHTAEAVILLYLIAFWADLEYLKPVFWGVLFHIFMDFFHLKRLDSLRVRTHSVFEFYFRKSALEKQGIFPCLLLQEAANSVDRAAS